MDYFRQEVLRDGVVQKNIPLYLLASDKFTVSPLKNHKIKPGNYKHYVDNFICGGNCSKN